MVINVDAIGIFPAIFEPKLLFISFSILITGIIVSVPKVLALLGPKSAPRGYF